MVGQNEAANPVYEVILFGLALVGVLKLLEILGISPIFASRTIHDVGWQASKQASKNVLEGRVRTAGIFQNLIFHIAGRFGQHIGQGGLADSARAENDDVGSFVFDARNHSPQRPSTTGESVTPFLGAPWRKRLP